MGYRLVSCELGDGLLGLFIAGDNAPSFIESMLLKPKQRERVSLIVRSIVQIEKNRISWCKETGKLRNLDSGSSLFEFKVASKVIRLMMYVHDNGFPVCLFDFDGHKGKRVEYLIAS